eukprot:4472351-Pleurochrysis_carterae.AAC.1
MERLPRVASAARTRKEVRGASDKLISLQPGDMLSVAHWRRAAVGGRGDEKKRETEKVEHGGEAMTAAKASVEQRSSRR